MPKKLTSADVEAFRAVLLQLRAELTGDIDKLEQDAFGSEGDKPSIDSQADAGSDAYSLEFNLELLERDEDAVRKIDAALDRCEDGTYGRCEECDTWITKLRLRAMPYASFCIDCQRSMEQEAG